MVSSSLFAVSIVQAIDVHPSKTEQPSIGTVDFLEGSCILFGRFGTPVELFPPVFHIFGRHLKNDGKILLRCIGIPRKCADRPENVANVTSSSSAPTPTWRGFRKVSICFWYFSASS